MVKSLLAIAASAALLTQSFALPTPEAKKRDWNDWSCNEYNIETRYNFASMPPETRKAYTDAIKCLMAQPSGLDPAKYPAARNRYLDYTAIHIERTAQVHLSGYFSTWHRYFNYLFEQDLRKTCGYTGPLPYWNIGQTSGDILNNPVFDGSEYSMSGNGIATGGDPIVLGPNLIIPHGSGGGCVTTGPFAGLTTTFAPIDPFVLINGLPLPPTTFDLNETCLIRDLNQYAASRWTNNTAVSLAVQSPTIQALEVAYNGILGGSELGVHSAGHFQVGGPMSSIHVSTQDPIWWPLHVFVDVIYTSWQLQHPDIAQTLYGTMTANNAPPSANVTLDSILPDWGYFDQSQRTVRELISTTAGPFCYKYDVVLS